MHTIATRLCAHRDPTLAAPGPLGGDDGPVGRHRARRRQGRMCERPEHPTWPRNGGKLGALSALAENAELNVKFGTDVKAVRPLPAEEGYKHWDSCEHFVSSSNQHCRPCNKCTSKVDTMN